VGLGRLDEVPLRVVAEARDVPPGVDDRHTLVAVAVLVTGYVAEGIGYGNEVAAGVVAVGGDSSRGVHGLHQAAGGVIDVPRNRTVRGNGRDLLPVGIILIADGPAEGIGHGHDPTGRVILSAGNAAQGVKDLNLPAGAVVNIARAVS